MHLQRICALYIKKDVWCNALHILLKTRRKEGGKIYAGIYSKTGITDFCSLLFCDSGRHGHLLFQRGKEQ